MTNTQEIAISKDFICPNQTSVDLLRKAQQDESAHRLFGDGDINNFTIHIVPNRVAEILVGFNPELYGKIATKEISQLSLLKMAQKKYEEEVGKILTKEPPTFIPEKLKLAAA